MNPTRYKAPLSGEKKIVFPALECWNPLTRVATIAAEVNKQRVSCRISLEILQKKFQASIEGPMLAIRANRPAIEAAAKKLIEKNAYEADGSIIIKNSDF